MKLKRLLTAEDAVSSVVATVLMIAIVVVIASVISTYVIGMADEVRNPAPQASIQETQESATVGIDGDGDYVDVTNVTLSHEAGDVLEAGTVEVTVNGQPAVGFSSDGTDDSAVVVPFQSGEITSSDSATVSFYADEGGTPTHGISIDKDGPGGLVSDSVSLAPIDSGDVVRVEWTSNDGDRSAFISTHEVS